jgi:hypothetical protein
VISEGLKKEGAAAFFTPVREHRKQASKQALRCNNTYNKARRFLPRQALDRQNETAGSFDNVI